MTSRNPKRRGSTVVPGAAHSLAKRPAKAGEDDWTARTLDEAIARSWKIFEQALADYPIVGTYWLYSGGNDSVILGHLLRGRFDAVLHVNTGTGIKQTTQCVRDVTEAWGLTLHELHPKNSYDDLVMGRVIASTGPNKGIRPIWRGFPGPPGHKVMYRHLKDEPLMRFRRSIVGTEGRSKKVIYLAGMRWDESDRRMRNAEPIDPEGAIVWVSPLVHWTNAHMAEYRARYRCQQDHDHAVHRLCFPEALPLNEVTEHLHMSGECLCGAFAKPGELDEIEFFYPDAAAPLRRLERDAEAAGIPACKWGQKAPKAAGGEQESGPAGRLCSSCVPEPDGDAMLNAWHAQGLLTAEQFTNLTAAADAPASEREPAVEHVPGVLPYVAADPAAVNTALVGDGFDWLKRVLPPATPLMCPRCRHAMRLGAVPLLWQCPRCDLPTTSSADTDWSTAA